MNDSSQPPVLAAELDPLRNVWMLSHAQEGVQTQELPQPSEQEMDIYFREQFGISLQEATQEVKYGDETQMLGAVLHHEKCPVGKWVRQANTEGGREAVIKKFSLFGQMATEFTVELADELPDIEVPAKTQPAELEADTKESKKKLV